MAIEEIKMITELELQNLQKLESRLTPENRDNAERYIRNCMEEPYASLLLGLFKREQENPLSRAFYIHELIESERFLAMGHDFVNVNPTKEFMEKRDRIFDAEREPHLQATLSHCEYLHLKAASEGKYFSLGTIIEFDPISKRGDKDSLFRKNSSLRIQEEEKESAISYFRDLLKNMKFFYRAAFSMGNSEMYAALVN